MRARMYLSVCLTGHPCSTGTGRASVADGHRFWAGWPGERWTPRSFIADPGIFGRLIARNGAGRRLGTGV
jgi:hypothetical protein